jgi:DNA polymerase-3 subunit gamma/tau
MSYLVLARKYRPRTFEEMVGQKAVVQTLQNAIKSNRVAQAYLFSGMRGVGKTTAARILAKALNCEHGPTPTPCNDCGECREINDDRSVDYLEIDGASNRGIDDIRALREAVKYKALHSRTKIVYIDEVHQITKEGFNALLKTLEEPPPNTVFIFATTEFHKVLPTIVSRCQHFEFRKVSQKDIIGHLRMIAEKEHITISPYGLGLIAAAADGSIRDSQSLLDQAVAFSGPAVDDDALKEILGAISRDLLFECSSIVFDEQPGLVFSFVEKVLEAGHDLRAFFKELIQHFRNLLVVKTAARPEDLLFFNAEEMGRLRAESGKATDEDLLRCLQALQAGEQGIKFAVYPQIALETLLVKLCHFRKLVPLKDLLQDPGPMKGAPAPAPASAPANVPVKSHLSSTRPGPGPAGFPKPSVSPVAGPEPAPAPRRPCPPVLAGSPGPSGPSGRERPVDQGLKHPGVKLFMDKMKARVVAEKPGPDVREDGES